MAQEQEKVQNSTDPNSEKTEIDQDEFKCGFGNWRPDWLQKFANPDVFFVIFCIIGIGQGAYFSYVAAILSTIEKRYSFSTTITGIILTADNVSPIIIGPLVGYYGGNANRPKWVAGGMVIVVVSYLVSALPYFFYRTASHLMSGNITLLVGNNNTENLYCGESDTEDCGSNDVTIPAVSCFIIGSFLKGFGSTAFYTIGTPYLDDNVKKRNSPMYLGLLGAFRLFGPTLGYLLASACLKYYEDPLIDPGFTRKDPRWIGAWWIGFVILGLVLFIFSMLMLLFPRRLKKTEPKKPEMTSLGGMMAAIRRLVKNPLLVCLFFAAAFRYSGMLGYYVTVARYVESQYRKPASEASLVSGPVGVAASQVGVFLGGLAIHKFMPSAKYLIGYIAFVDLTCILAYLSSMGLGCPGLNMPGTTTVGGMLSLTNECNAQCQCTTRAFQPICAPDGTYFSPCFAGCTGYNGSVYTGCACLENPETIATSGYCPDDECNMLTPFIAVFGTGKFLAATAYVMQALVLLRSVKVEDKSIVMGAFEAFLSVLSFIPYPFVYGALVDSTCSVWEKTCGTTGNCWIYDNDKLRYYIHGVSAGLMLLAGIFDIGMFALSGRLQNIYEEDDQRKDVATVNSDCTLSGQANSYVQSSV